MNVLVLHGPNLNLLGRREPEIYGAATLEEVERRCTHLAVELGLDIDHFQTNHEGEMIDRIHASAHVDGFVVNAGGWTHTSVALRDAFLAMARPLVEVHCSNPLSREEFRHVSFLADIAVGTVTGFGPESYALGLRGLVEHLKARGERA